MTQEDVIRLAREAGFSDWALQTPNDFLIFAELVAGHEREACAKVCDEIEWRFKELLDKFLYELDAGGANGAQQCAQKIRARGQA
jgi:hypothetical protein